MRVVDLSVSDNTRKVISGSRGSGGYASGATASRAGYFPSPKFVVQDPKKTRTNLVLFDDAPITANCTVCINCFHAWRNPLPMMFVSRPIYTVSQKRTNFETVGYSSKIIRIDFDDIRLKYSNYSRIEILCFSFHAGFIVIDCQTAYRK